MADITVSCYCRQRVARRGEKGGPRRQGSLGTPRWRGFAGGSLGGRWGAFLGTPVRRTARIGAREGRQGGGAGWSESGEQAKDRRFERLKPEARQDGGVRGSARAGGPGTGSVSDVPRAQAAGSLGLGGCVGGVGSRPEPAWCPGWSERGPRSGDV